MKSISRTFYFFFSDAELALQKAESRANHLELSLEANKTSLENNSTDQVVKEELQKVLFVSSDLTGRQLFVYIRKHLPIFDPLFTTFY